MKTFNWKVMLFLLCLVLSSACTAQVTESIPIASQTMPVPGSFVYSSPTPVTIATNTPTATITPTPIITASPSNITPAATQVRLPDDIHGYIGLRYDTLPEGLKGGTGWLIDPFGRSKEEIQYAMDFVVTGEIEMLWLVRRKCAIIDNSQYCVPASWWEVVDVMQFPELTGEDDVFIPAGCLLNGEIDELIMVTAVLDHAAFVRRYVTNEKILSAWRLDLTNNQIIEIETNGIECYADLASSARP